MIPKRRRKSDVVGKKIVYITEYRSTAVEVMKEYQHKGYSVGMEREPDREGRNVYVVYVYPRD